MINESNMPKEWIEKTLGEVVERITKGTTPKTFSVNENDVNYIKSDALNYGGFLDKNKFVKITQEVNDELKRSQLNIDDVLLSMAGEYLGKTGLVKDEHLPANTNQAVAIITVDKNIIYPIFLWYNLRDTNTVKYFKSIPSQSAQPNINFQEIKTLSIKIPPIPEQKSIAAILTSFDEKIELLQAQNKTLEELAQTIFTEWFGKYEMGDELPEGWREGKLGDEFDITIGRTPPRIEQEWFSDTPTGKKWISIKDMGNSGVFIFDTSEYLTDEAISKFNIPIIPENTTLLSFKMTVGKLAITTEEMLSNEAIAHLKIKRDSYLTSEYIYLYLQNLDFNSLGSTSSIVTAINSTIIKKLDFVIPQENILKDFQEIIHPIFDKIKTNTEQIQTLTKTRDELLPKLMSGEIRVKM
ncbi:restriction endonuclease subunit S [Flavobacteriaceae bacterium W22]|nr:restriction endonuclease subunit S [Flavobacteriaceae bacterium W22]